MKPIISTERKNSFIQSNKSSLPYWIAAVVVGIMTAYYCKLYEWLQEYGKTIFLEHPWFIFIQIPVSFILAWLIIRYITPLAFGGGNSQVMLAISMANNKKDETIIDKLINIKVLFGKIASSALMIFGGGAMGPEGPTIQMSASVFRWIQKKVPISWGKVSTSNMIIAGAASGLAAAFNTPLGGVIFAIEELLKTRLKHQFVTIIFISVIIGGLVATSINGGYLYLEPISLTKPTWMIILLVIFVAIACGAMGAYLSEAIYHIGKWKKAFRKTSHHLLFLIIAGLFIATLIYILGVNVMGSGKEVMKEILDGKTIGNKGVLLFDRLIGPLVASSTGSAGGFFAPGLSAGAAFGAWIGSLLHFNLSDTNILVLAGMAAFLTGILRVPCTCAIMVLEMTNTANIAIFHVMIAAIVANLIAQVVDKESIYEKIKHNLEKEIKDIAIPQKT